MEEGREIEAGSATETSNKVVRLPRDWLGPPEELVPFGQPAPPPTEPDLAEFAPNDFWGERAAAIHSAVHVPTVEPPEDPPPSDAPAPTTKVRLGRGHLGAAALLAVAAAAAVALLFGGSSNHAAPGTRLNIAAIVSSGVSRILKLGPPRVVARTTSPRPVRHVHHRSPRPKASPARAQHRSSPPPASTYVAHVSPPSPQPTYHPSVSAPAPRIVASPHPTQSSTSSVATVSPTGQNGALGPVQSPNG